MKKKKAEIAMSMIIWAALGLVVLILFIVILTGKVSWFNKNTPDNCQPPNRCYIDKSKPCLISEGEMVVYTDSCPANPDAQPGEKNTGICCKKAFA